MFYEWERIAASEARHAACCTCQLKFTTGQLVTRLWWGRDPCPAYLCEPCFPVMTVFLRNDALNRQLLWAADEKCVNLTDPTI